MVEERLLKVSVEVEMPSLESGGRLSALCRVQGPLWQRCFHGWSWLELDHHFLPIVSSRNLRIYFAERGGAEWLRLRRRDVANVLDNIELNVFLSPTFLPVSIFAQCRLAAHLAGL